MLVRKLRIGTSERVIAVIIAPAIQIQTFRHFAKLMTHHLPILLIGRDICRVKLDTCLKVCGRILKIPLVFAGIDAGKGVVCFALALFPFVVRHARWFELVFQSTREMLDGEINLEKGQADMCMK